MRNGHIAILLPDLRGGGAERVNLDLAAGLARRGYQVEFVLMRACGAFLPEAEANFSVIDMGVHRMRQVPTALARYLRSNRPDALLAGMWPLTVLAPIGRLLSGHHCRLVSSEHCVLSKQYASWGAIHRIALRTSMGVGYRMADACHGVSRGVANDMARLAALRSNRVHSIHNPIPARPQPTPDALALAEALWGVGAGERVLSVGSFKAQKNHSLLLRAFATMHRSDSARLILLGEGAGEADLRVLATGLGIGEKVIFAGFHADPTPFYSSADLFVLSSTYEGFGNVIVEALACGTPVVSTDCPAGPREILADGEFGRLVPVGDVEALAQAMQAALEAPSNAAALKARAQDFSIEKAMDEYERLLFPSVGGGTV